MRMRFMVLLKVEAEPGPELNRAMRAYDAELVRAGVADRTRLSARGARTTPDADAGGRTVAGFWVFDLDSREDAAAWVRRCPAPADGSSEIEIRLLLEPGDLSERPVQGKPRPAWERAMAF
jgi:hypothetical protein